MWHETDIQQMTVEFLQVPLRLSKIEPQSKLEKMKYAVHADFVKKYEKTLQYAVVQEGNNHRVLVQKMLVLINCANYA